MKSFWDIFRISTAFKWKTFLTVLYNILFVLFNLISIVLFIPFLQLIFPEDPNKIEKIIAPHLENDWSNLFSYLKDLFQYKMQVLVDENPHKALFIVCLSVILAFFLKGLFRYLAIYHHSFIKVAVVRDLRQKLYNKAMNLPMSFYTNERKGDLITRINNDVGEFEFASIAIIELIFREPFAIIISLGTLIYISPQLTLVSFILLPISALIISTIGKSLKRTAKQGQHQLGSLMSFLDETLGGVRIIKAFHAGNYMKKSFSKINERHRFLQTKTYRKKDLSSPLNEVIGSFVLIGLVWFGGNMVLSGESSDLKGPQFVTFIILFSQLLRPIQGIATSISTINKAQVSLARIQEILDLKEEQHVDKELVKFSGLANEIKFENAYFKYQDEWVFEDLNLTLPKGKMIALVGESGSGKSTIADLILRFYLLDKGNLFFDDLDINDIQENDLRRHIGVVNQESILFNDTVKNNIAFGMMNVNMDEIIEAAKIANAHEFIEQLEHGYETVIGERGNKLSGGQKQRISIARTVLRNPSILILDEATSALDNESEKQVQEALEKLMKGRTSIVIAHRLSTIQNADIIVVLAKGKVLEMGNHNDLIAKNGVYAQLYNSVK